MTRKQKTRRKRLLNEVKFQLRPGQSLVVAYPLFGGSLERVIVENRNGQITVEAMATSGMRFEFSDKKIEKNTCDFWLASPKSSVWMGDIIRSKFWGQFNFGELRRLLKDRKLNKKLDKKIQKLVLDFESKAAQELNRLVKR